MNVLINRSKKDITKKFINLGYKEQSDGKQSSGTYRFDKICPNFFFLWLLKSKSEFSQSQIVTSSEVVLQNKAFTIGPSMFCKLLNYYEITGDILQTHILSPRSTAYLASLLIKNKWVGKFRVFGAGKSIKEYQAYFDKVGAKNVKLYEENYLHYKKNFLEKTVAIYSTPPSSYSAISDPIELICSRGGDLKMLQFLSESEMDNDGQLRAAKILEEQRETLKNAMSKPQIQFILYETHSIVESENEDMVSKAMEYMNRKAKDKHYLKALKEKEKIDQLEAAKENLPGIPTGHRESKLKKQNSKVIEVSNVKLNMKKLKASVMKNASQSSIDSKLTELSDDDSKSTADVILDVRVPLTDQFELVPIPDFCK